MSSVEYSILAFIATILVGVIGYFLTDAHNQLKIKADKESLTNAVDSLRREQLAAEERYRREADKMEKQYDVGISKNEAMMLLESDIDVACMDLDKDLPWWREMTDSRQQVLANMCFN